MTAYVKSIDCDGLDEHLLDYLYEELPEDERQRVEAHVAGCARCAAEIAAFRRVRQAARALPDVDPSPQVTIRLLEAAAGRNVVPLPLPARAATSASKEAILAEPHQAAASAVGVAAAARASGSVTAGAPANAIGGVVPIQSARTRRWLFHPGFAAAASFVAVGLGTMWFLSTNRSAVTAPQAMNEVAQSEAPAPASPPVAAPTPTAIQPPEPEAPAEGATATEDELKAAPVRASRAVANDEEHAARPMAKAILEAPTAVSPGAGIGRGPGRAAEGGGGGAGLGAFGSSGDGYVAAPAAHGRASGQPIGLPSPAPARDPVGKGVSLHADENETLERSVEATRESAKKRDNSADKRSVSDELARAEAPPAPSKTPPNDRAWAAPPPPPASAPGSAQLSQPGSSMGAIGGAVARNNEPRADSDDVAGLDQQAPAVANQRARQQNKQSQVVAFQDAARRRNCREFLDAYRELKATDPTHAFATNERLNVASCYGKTGQLDQARAEYDALRASHPELAPRIDSEQARLQLLQERDQVAQRKAAEAPAAAPAKAKAQPRSKAGKAAADAAISY